MFLSAIVLAAGKGTRMNSSTQKVFHKIAGLPILGHIMLALKCCNIQQTIVVLSQDASIEALPDDLRNVDIARQIERNGTGGAVIQALGKLRCESEYALILYGDTPLITADSINKAILESSGSDVHILATRPSTNKPFGKLFLDECNNVCAIIEPCDERSAICPNLCNAGMIIKTDVLKKYIRTITPNNIKNEIFLTDIVELAYNAGLKCTYSELPYDEMCGINTMRDLAEVEAVFQHKMRETFMNCGVHMVAPETVFFSYDTIIEKDVEIAPYVVFGPGVHIKEGSVIESFCHIVGADVDQAAVGPFARLRKGSYLHKKSKIGNFVEIKNSEISEGAKINHLSYIGDASIGCKTNVGAGTITCNYDGYKKFRTSIGNDVFIGSNTSLLAPISIGTGSIIAAGSTISENVEDGEIAIARHEQTNISGAAVRYHEKRRK